METEKTLQTIEKLLQRQQYTKVSDLLQKMIDIEIEQHKSIQETVDFFNKVYDKLYYYIIFNKLNVDKATIKQLESLAMPLKSRTEEKWKELFENSGKEKK